MATSGHRRNWADLPIDLLGLILEKLILLHDYIRFGAVCKAWRSAAVDNHQARRRTCCQQPPLLLLQPPPHQYDHRSLYSILDHRIYSQPLPVPYTGPYFVTCGSGYGWFAVTFVRDSSVTLFNPFSQRALQLPSICHVEKRWTSKVSRFILSCDPGLNPNDWVGIAIYGMGGRLAILRAGQDSWYNLRDPTPRVLAAGFCKGYLYVMDNSFKLLRIGIYHDFGLVKKVKPLRLIPVDYLCSKFYLVELEGELLLICRRYINDICSKLGKPKRETKHEDGARTVGFCVYKLHLKGHQPSAFDSDDELAEWIEIRDLGEFCLFLGENQPICISTAIFRDCRPNCIYYTADTSSINVYIPDNADDMGVFDLATGQFCSSLPPQLSEQAAAIWISPSLG